MEKKALSENRCSSFKFFVMKWGVVSMILLSGATGFAAGAYFQDDQIRRNLKKLMRNDPYAFYIRHKLCDAFLFWKLSLLSSVENDSLDRSTALPRIMKYGFPGLDDIRLYADFVLSYDRRNRVAHWVYEHLTAECLANGETASQVRRSNAQFQPDMEIPSNFRADLEDYKDSGFDRGHLAAAGNHKASQTHCNETFYLTNIAPQVGRGFNQNAWNKLENYVRELTLRYGSVYVCTGPLYLPQCSKDQAKWVVEHEVIGVHSVAVPTHFFKVITVESKLPGGSPYMEAYVMPNAPLRNDIDIRVFLCDIADIEYAAGLQFFRGIRRSFFFSTNYPTAQEIFANFQ